jgi:hypothetical protein
MADDDLQDQTPTDDIAEQPDGSAVVDLADVDDGLTPNPDGSVTVELKDSGPQSNEDFYANLADEFGDFSLAMRFIELIDKDKEDRKKRDEQYEEGIRRTGLGNDAPGGASFAGASKVVHPAMAEACVDFEARAIKELFPPDGPVKTHIIGKNDDEKLQRAERKRDWLNWQLQNQIEEFCDEEEQLLTQLPLGGSQYLKIWYEPEKKRPCVEFLPIDRMILPFAAANFYTAERASEVHEITQWEFDRRVRSGMYTDTTTIKVVMEPDQTAAQKATNKVEGKSMNENVDGIRTVYHIYTYLEFEDDTYSKGQMAPYILMIDSNSHDVLGLYRNWEAGDATLTKMDWVVEFKFIPWRGVYAVGLPHLIGGLSAALTGALRALLDSAHINNSATALKLKGAKISGQSAAPDVTQVIEIEGAPGVNDIRMLAMPMPFNPPSPVLFQLMGFLQENAKGVVTTSEEKIADATSSMPVGTTQALIEQGAVVFSAIHSRLHRSQAKVLEILCRLNRWYLDEQRRGPQVADLPISREDFGENTDVLPVSDPHIFSETQRMAQNQSVLALAQQFPQAFNVKAVLSRVLKQMKVPNINEILTDTPSPEQRTSADENAAMMIGQPAYAYMPQDHIAHIQDHLQFALNPFFGQSPFADPSYLNHLIEHLKQHMMLWYINRANGYVTKANRGKPVDDYEEPALTPTIDKLYTVAGAHVDQDAQQVFGAFQQAIGAIIQMAQQRQQQAKQNLPPDAQVVKDTAMAETQRKAQEAAKDLQFRSQELAVRHQEAMAKLQTQADIENAKITHQAITDTLDRAAAMPPMPGAMPPPPGVAPMNGAPTPPAAPAP